jgi:hypothetical protein
MPSDISVFESIVEGDDELKKLIEEIVPELKIPVPKPQKPIGFFKAMSQAVKHWWGFNSPDDGWREIKAYRYMMRKLWVQNGANIGLGLGLASGENLLGLVALGAAASFLIVHLNRDTEELTGEVIQGKGSTIWFFFSYIYLLSFGMINMLPGQTDGMWLISFIFPVWSWIIYAIMEMRKSRDRASKPHIRPPLPDIEEIQRRFLEKMKSVVEESQKMIVGSGSEVGRQVETLKGKQYKAENILRRFEEHCKRSPDNQEYKRQCNLARETILLFKGDLSALEAERTEVLRQCGEVVSFIPQETERLEVGQLISELAILRGEALESRQVSRSILMEAVRPMIEKFVPLAEARERLLMHANALIDGEPGSLAGFIGEAESSGQRIAGVEGVERKLRLLTGGE